MVRTPGIVFAIQSPVADPKALKGHMTEFLTNFNGQIEAMTQAELDKFKAGLASQLLEKDKNLQERSARFHSELTNREFEFNSQEKIVEALNDITVASFSKFYKDFVKNSGARGLLVQSIGNKHQKIYKKSEPIQAKAIKDSARFKLDKSYFGYPSS